MKLVCAWCNKVLRDGDSRIVSHGICPVCKEEVIAEMNEYLEKQKQG
jgi:phage FluMu protein Com